MRRFLFILAFSVLFVNCAPFLDFMAKDDPCWKVRKERDNLRKETDAFERQMIQLRIDALEKNCSDNQQQQGNEARERARRGP
jgi:hypothetical protein